MSDDETEAEPLTREQVAGLVEGTPIVVVWSGGNGPHRYTATRAPSGEVLARSEWDRADYYDFDGRCLTGTGSFVGRERFHTRVWLRAGVHERRRTARMSYFLESEMYPGRCLNHRRGERCLELDATEHVCRFPPHQRPVTTIHASMTSSQIAPKPWVVPPRAGDQPQ